MCLIRCRPRSNGPQGWFGSYRMLIDGSELSPGKGTSAESPRPLATVRETRGRALQQDRGYSAGRRILPSPLLHLSAFFEAARRDYYEGLRGVSERGAWADWIEYFLLGVARMSEDALSRASRMNGRLAEWQRVVAGDSTNAPLRGVELLAANPFITAKGAAAKLEVAFTTAQRAIERLERLKIVQQVGDAKRDRVYCANVLLAILEEPARLTPGQE